MNAVTRDIEPFIIFMDTSSAIAQDHLREAIDDEIKVSNQVTQELKYRHNALAPISRLPHETLAEIFSLLSFPGGEYRYDHYMKWICVTHVCRRWCEIALCFPYLWNHIKFTSLTLPGVTEMLARAKMSPLKFEARSITPSNKARFKAFGEHLEAHISHTRHLSISGNFRTVLKRLVSPAPALVSLSLMTSSCPYTSSPCFIPDSLFNGTAPMLTRLKLLGYCIESKSPLLKGLQTLEIAMPSTQATPTLGHWLASLNEMSQLKTLMLANATPAIFIDSPHISEPQRTVTLPSLTHFDITTSAKGCALALAHLVLPALISLEITSESQSRDGDDVRRLLIPYVARNAHGPQDAAPLQTILLDGGSTHAQIVAWTVPDADVDVCDSGTLFEASASARLVLCVTSDGGWRDGTDTAIFDAMLSTLPLNAISTLSAQNKTRLTKEVWLSHAPRLAMLQRVLLAHTAVRAFRKMLVEDAPPDGLPRLPQLTKLILFKVPLTVLRTYRLCDMLVQRKEHGVPLEALDLRMCFSTERAIELLSETVGSVQRPPVTLKTEELSMFTNWEGNFGPFDEEERTEDVEYYDGPVSWYGSMAEDEDEGEDEDEDEDEDEFDNSEDE
jgi:hypothetical protein